MNYRSLERVPIFGSQLFGLLETKTARIDKNNLKHKENILPGKKLDGQLENDRTSSN